MHGWVMWETSIMNNLNWRVCKENKIEFELEEKINAYWNNFVVIGVSLKDHIGRMGEWIKMIFSRMIQHNINLLVQVKGKFWP